MRRVALPQRHVLSHRSAGHPARREIEDGAFPVRLPATCVQRLITAGTSQVTCHPAQATEMCSQTVPQMVVASAPAASDATPAEQRHPSQLKARQRALHSGRSTIRSLSALALMDCSTTSPYSSWANSFLGKAPDVPPPHCVALRPVRLLPHLLRRCLVWTVRQLATSLCNPASSLPYGCPWSCFCCGLQPHLKLVCTCSVAERTAADVQPIV